MPTINKKIEDSQAETLRSERSYLSKVRNDFWLEDVERQYEVVLANSEKYSNWQTAVYDSNPIIYSDKSLTGLGEQLMEEMERKDPLRLIKFKAFIDRDSSLLYAAIEECEMQILDNLCDEIVKHDKSFSFDNDPNVAFDAKLKLLKEVLERSENGFSFKQSFIKNMYSQKYEALELFKSTQGHEYSEADLQKMKQLRTFLDIHIGGKRRFDLFKPKPPESWAQRELKKKEEVMTKFEAVMQDKMDNFGDVIDQHVHITKGDFFKRRPYKGIYSRLPNLTQTELIHQFLKLVEDTHHSSEDLDIKSKNIALIVRIIMALVAHKNINENSVRALYFL